MFKFVLLLLAAAGLNARPLQYNALRIQNGGWVIGAPQLVQDGQEYMGSSGPAEQHRRDTNPEPQWKVVLAPEHTVKMRDGKNHKAAPPEERRQGTEPSRRFLVDLNTGLIKEYISEMDRRTEVYHPVSKSEFRQGTQNSRVTLVDVRTGQQLPQLSEMQRRAQAPSEFRQGTEYNEATVIKSMETVHKAGLPEFLRQGTEPSRRILVDPKTGLVKENVSEMQRRASGFYNPVSNPEFRQGTQNSRVTLVNVRTGQQLPQLSEMQRRAAPEEFRQGTEYHTGTLMNLRKAHTMTKVSKDKTAQEMGTNEVFPEFKRGFQYSQAQRRHILDRKALESDEVVLSSPLEEFKRGMEYSHANIIDL
ncbi:uncharacterized protein Hap1MRO34_020269 [Clarias gariepinus]